MKEFAIEIGGKALKYIKTHQIDLEIASETYMRNQIGNVQYFIKNQEDFAAIDIRKFLVAKKGKEK